MSGPESLKGGRAARLRASLFVAVLGLGGLAGCASTPPPAMTEFAPGVEVSSYASFAFYEPLALEREGYGTFTGERARAVLRREMESRGFRLDPERPALRVNLVAGAPPAGSSPRFSLGLGLGMGGGNTRGGIGVGIPLGGAKRDDRRLPGTIAVDLVDVAANRVVWTGSVALERTGREGEQAAFEAALVRVMGGLPPRETASR